MRFLVDMNLPPALARELNARGHDAIHLRDEGLNQLRDEEVFRKAASERRVVVTFDLDFGRIMAVNREASISVILLRMRFADVARVLQRIESLLSQVGPDLEQGAIVIVEQDRIRSRRIPLDG